MKSVGDLTEIETLKLQAAQATLREHAHRFVFKPNSDTASMLYVAAHDFSNVLKEIGMEDHWITVPWVIDTDPDLNLPFGAQVP